MKPAEKVQEWLHYFHLLQSDEAKCALFVHLKNDKSAVAKEALAKMTEKWLAS